ncbi:DMT family transporter [Microbacterium sp.]|uniref:DMT family transporter n=1 Tax=Microbacterium sp. TaxID=51671 RepID=UPI003A8AD0F7
MTRPASPAVPARLAIGGAVLVGVLTAVQARVNGELGVQLDDGLVAAVISFGSGLVLVGVLSLALPGGRRGTAQLVAGLRAGSIPWWMLVGGVAGAVTVATQGLTVAIIGVSLFTVGVVAGQTLNGLVLDRVGFGPGGEVAVTMPRVAGGALALAAAVIAIGREGVGDSVAWWMLLLPFVTGVGIAWQQATNGRLRQRVGTPMTATVVNFIGGTAVLAIAAAVSVGVNGPPRTPPSDPWLYTGGAIGVAYIFLSAALVAYTGVLLLGLGAVAGQLVTAFVLDILWPAAASSGWGSELLTVTVALASVAVAVLPWRCRR